MEQETVSPPPQKPSSDANLWAMLCHLSMFSGYVTGIGFVLGPLIVWLIKKDEFHEVDAHGKEALNFAITMMIASIVSVFLVFIIIGFFLLLAIMIITVVFPIIAAIKANNGEAYRYPLTIRFVN